MMDVVVGVTHQKKWNWVPGAQMAGAECGQKKRPNIAVHSKFVREPATQIGCALIRYMPYNEIQ